MIRKTFGFILLAASTCVVGTAQTPAPKADPHVFSFSFDGDGGYLGVQTEEITRENATRFGLRGVRGVSVAKVLEGSPAQSAGLKDGDVILKVNGEEITSSRKLTRLISEISPDHTAKLAVLRGGSEREINVTLGKRPMPKFDNGNFEFKMPPMGKMEFPDLPDMHYMPELGKLPRAPMAPGEPMVWAFGNRRQIGVGLTPLTKQLSDHFGVDGGALVNTVRENSPAAKAGLKAGDIIVEVDGKAVKGDHDLIRAIGEKKEGDVALTIVRDRNRQTIRVTPEEGKGGFDNFFEFSDSPDVPGAPPAPGVFKMTRPATPMPLNNLFVPGRIV